MDEIIKNDPTLNYFINTSDIDWFNEHQVNLRIAALKIALMIFLRKY